MATMPYFRQGQPERGRGGSTPRHFAHSLRRWGGQSVPLAKGHP
jgi:hypothetical protein